MLEGSCSIVFAFALPAFLTASSSEFKSRFWASNYAWIKSPRPFQKYLVKMFLFGVTTRSNFSKTTCRCSDVLSSRGLPLTVLEVPLNFFPIVVYKSSRVFQASIEKRFKLILRDQNRAVCIPFLLKLLLVEADPIPKEGCGKRNLVRLFNSNSGKIILILLTRVVVFYVRFPAIHIREASF